MTAPADVLDEHADRVPRDLVHVRGADAAAFLEGQLSQEVGDLDAGTSRWSFLLQPQGKVDALLRVGRTPDGFVLDVDAGAGAAVAARLGRFLLRMDVAIEVEPAAADAPTEAEEAWRIEHGVPAMGAEITPEVIPAELGQWIVDAGVSFTKGCFTGQELVARVDSRGGNVPHPLRVLVLEAPVSSGATVEVDGAEVGRVTSAATSPTAGPVALAFVHRTVEPPAAVTVHDGDRRVAATVRPSSPVPPGA